MKPNLRAISTKIEQQLSALNATEYRVTLQNANKAFVFCNRLLKPSEILEEKRLFVLDKKNMVEKMNVYITPISDVYDFYLVDDVLDEDLQELKTQYNICCLMQTSYKNFQVILKTEHQNIPGSVKSEYLKQLNKQYGDPSISGYPHAFRSVGFKNVKPQYLDSKTNYYPIISLVWSRNETCNKTTLAILELFDNFKPKPKTNTHYKQIFDVMQDQTKSELLNTANDFYKTMQQTYGEKVDLSKADFTLLKLLMSSNVEIDTAVDIIRQCSPFLSKRHINTERYLQTTKDNFMQQS